MAQPLILLLDINGLPNRWCHWQDSVIYYAKNLVEWSLGEMSFTFYGGENSITGNTSSITTASIIAVKGTSKNKRVYRQPTLTNQALFRRDKFVCAYCNSAFASDHELTRDHVHPVSKGGKDSWVNVVTACRRCNHKKSDYLLSDKNLDMQLQYQPYQPCRSEWLILTNRKILPDQREFLVGTISNKKSRILEI